jgi:hypothetical protein
LIAYGHDPIYPNHRRGRDYYSDEEPGRYRRRGGSRSSSPDTRSRSRAAKVAAGGAAIGGAALAAHEMGKRRERSRVAAKDNRRMLMTSLLSFLTHADQFPLSRSRRLTRQLLR